MAEETPEAQVVHLTRRRVRIRIPSKRHDRSFFAKAVKELSQRAPAAQMEANPATASILIRCEDDVLSLLGALGGDAPVSITSLTGASAPNIDHIRERVKEFNDKVRRWTGGSSDARTLIFLALLLSAIYQLARGQIFAPAATLLWYAGEALRFWTSQKEALEGETAESERKARFDSSARSYR
jgi:hypothetical protein